MKTHRYKLPDAVFTALADILKDRSYLLQMKELEGSTTRGKPTGLCIDKAVPISGLIMNYFFRYENEHRTVLEVWGHSTTTTSAKRAVGESVVSLERMRSNRSIGRLNSGTPKRSRGILDSNTFGGSSASQLVAAQNESDQPSAVSPPPTLLESDGTTPRSSNLSKLKRLTKKMPPPPLPAEMDHSTLQSLRPIRFDLADYRDYLQRKNSLPPPPLEPYEPFLSSSCGETDSEEASSSDSTRPTSTAATTNTTTFILPPRSASRRISSIGLAQGSSRPRSMSLDASTMHKVSRSLDTDPRLAADTNSLHHHHHHHHHLPNDFHGGYLHDESEQSEHHDAEMEHEPFEQETYDTHEQEQERSGDGTDGDGLDSGGASYDGHSVEDEGEAYEGEGEGEYDEAELGEGEGEYDEAEVGADEAHEHEPEPEPEHEPEPEPEPEHEPEHEHDHEPEHEHDHEPEHEHEALVVSEE